MREALIKLAKPQGAVAVNNLCGIGLYPPAEDPGQDRDAQAERVAWDRLAAIYASLAPLPHSVLGAMRQACNWCTTIDHVGALNDAGVSIDRVDDDRT